MKINTSIHPTYRNYLFLAWLLAFILALWVQAPRLRDPFAVEEDFRNMYWVHRLQDKSLFPTVDFTQFSISEYEIGPLHLIAEDTSPGYSLLFQIASLFMSPILFHKLLLFPLLLIAVYYLFRIGEQLTTPGTTFVLAATFIILNLAAHTEISVVGGLHRSFVTPFLLALVYYLMTERYRTTAVLLFIIGIIYAPIFPTAVFTYTLCLIRFRQDGQWQLTIKWQPLIYLLIAALFVIAALSPILLDQLGRAQASTAAVNAEAPHILDDPSFSQGGRRPLFLLFPIIGRGGFASTGEIGVPLLIMAFFACLIAAIKRFQLTFHPVLTRLFGASLIAFTFAWLSLWLTSSFLFYVPSRHTQSVFFILLIIFIIINAEDALNKTARWLQEQQQNIVWYTLPFIIIAIGFVLFLPSTTSEGEALVGRGGSSRTLLLTLSGILLVLTLIVAKRRTPAQAPTAVSPIPATNSRRPLLILGILILLIAPFYIRAFQAYFAIPSQQERTLFTQIRTLPLDAHISGDPCLLDGVPFYGQRAVLFSCERFKFLGDQEAKTVTDTFLAYYAETPEEITQFCQKYDVDYLVVDKNAFARDYINEGDFFFEPYNSTLMPIIQSRANYYLATVTAETAVLNLDPIFVIECTSTGLP